MVDAGATARDQSNSRSKVVASDSPRSLISAGEEKRADERCNRDYYQYDDTGSDHRHFSGAGGNALSLS